jgi:hypothetical protein
MTPRAEAAKMKGNPPTTLTVIKVVIADNP